MIDPDPALVAVKVTEQLVTPDVVESVQVLEPSVPPVVPAVRVKVTVPVGEFDGVVVSLTVAVIAAAQLVVTMSQLAFRTPVTVVSEGGITVTVLDVPLLVLCPGAGLMSPL